MTTENKEPLQQIKQIMWQVYPNSYALRQSYLTGAKKMAELMKEKEDERMIAFAEWMRDKSWEHDHREQRSHTIAEHLQLFKASQGE